MSTLVAAVVGEAREVVVVVGRRDAEDVRQVVRARDTTASCRRSRSRCRRRRRRGRSGRRLIALYSACEELDAAERGVDDPRAVGDGVAVGGDDVARRALAGRRRGPRTGMRLACQATPVTPMPLLPRAPMMPATCVPWPFVVGAGRCRRRRSRSRRRGWRRGRDGSRSTPESTTATLTVELPVVTPQAAGAPMSAPARPARCWIAWPVLCRAHRFANGWSLSGAPLASTRASSG